MTEATPEVVRKMERVTLSDSPDTPLFVPRAFNFSTLLNVGWNKGEFSSGQRDSNPQPQPWRACVRVRTFYITSVFAASENDQIPTQLLKVTAHRRTT
jgi:hypothetical protein